MTTVTQWFRANRKPVHIGVYESIALVDGKNGEPTMAARWDGHIWRWESGNACLFQRRKWRGLAEKPQL